MKRPKSQIGQSLLAAEEERLWGRALFWWIVAVGGAFVAAWAWQDKGWLDVPEGQVGDVRALYQAAFTGIAATALLIPAFAAFFFRNRAPRVWRLWEAFWTAAYVAYLVHFGWSLWAIYGGDVRAAVALSHIPQFWPAIVIALWWPVDLWLASRDADEAWWDGAQRWVLHGTVLGLFVWSAAWEGELLATKVAGFALAGATIASAFDAWTKWRRTRGALE